MLEEYTGGLRNPLKGLRTQNRLGESDGFITLSKWYIPWNELEASSADGLEKILAYGDRQWMNACETNTKVIPRVYLSWPGVGEYWPADMTSGDYASEAFRSRVVRLIRKMAQAWDNDPRVAYMEMGIVGYWGEQHTPTPTPDLQELLAETFLAHFKNKLVMVRNPSSQLFINYPFGLYWDEWGSDMQWAQWDHIDAVLTEAFRDRWKTAVFGGENTCNLYGFDETGGRFLTFGIDRPFTAEEGFGTKLPEMVRYARLTHTNHMETAQVPEDSPAFANLQVFQNTLGYRFVIREATVLPFAQPGEDLSFSFSVINTGSSPLYDDWPVQVSLLEPSTRQPAVSEVLENVSAADWMPGEQWDGAAEDYRIPPTVFRVEGRLRVPAGLQAGMYELAAAILDPAGMRPSARFANLGYARGGYTVMARLSVGEREQPASPAPGFDDPRQDDSLRYYPNLSRFRPCRCNGKDASALVDGTLTTVWRADSSAKQAISVDLGEPCSVKSLEIYWNRRAPYTVETSEDGERWISCRADTHIGRNGVTRNILDSGNVRYVRLLLRESENGMPASAYALHVYGEHGRP